MKSSQKPNKTRNIPPGLTSLLRIYKLESGRKLWLSYYKLWTVKIIILEIDRKSKFLIMSMKVLQPWLHDSVGAFFLAL